ncbi:aldo/keto reductase [Stakelama saccharophila]|uniref:Aldo/keto reductase n=1 Tax=Stakelama saccharophila TaxID=3075605 RepID=A0ABZ0BB92_9SPHN|nr:aldo/keto reductase [Stakelama sp. W311]WNO53951.1 aldo/keto reductase [Stakelama sp. W311]
MTDTPMLQMNDGRHIPALGLGTYKIPDSQADAVVRRGIDLGYRLVDTAAMYDNERGVGSGVADDDTVFLTTKLWNPQQGHDAAMQAFEESLALLGRDDVDLYLIHWPCPAQDRYVETWKALIGLRKSGRAKSIGVSNFLPEHIERIAAETGELPAVNQIELHPGFQQRQARAFHDRHGIVTQSWSPLGQGAALKDRRIAQIAEKHDRSAAQVVLRWHLQSGLSVIPKAGAPDHLADNLGALGWTLDDEDMAAIDRMDDPDGRIGPHPNRM